MLCQGLERGEKHPKIKFPNEHLETIQGAPWTGISTLVGSGNERVMFNLLLDCAIFAPIGESRGFYQLSGRLTFNSLMVSI